MSVSHDETLPTTRQRLRLNLMALRKRQGWSLQRAAEHIGITKPHLWDLEQTRSSNPTLATLEGLADAYDVDLKALLFEDLHATGGPLMMETSE